jgi:hypothetical protein
MAFDAAVDEEARLGHFRKQLTEVESRADTFTGF